MSAKSNSLWWPRYVGDYQRKTAHLSLVEHGVYALLLDHYYSTGSPLPANAPVLQRVCRAFAPEEQAAVQSVVDQFFTLEDDGYHNAKADEELSKRCSISEKRAKAAAEKHKKAAANAGANAGANARTTTTTTTEVSSGVERAGNSDGAVSIIAAFDQARVHHFGPELARPWPTATDKMTAQRWLDAGADIDLCRDVFNAGFARKASARDGPPDSLKFFEKSIANAIAEQARPMPEGKSNGAGSRNRHQYDPDEARRSTLEAFPDLMGGSG